MAAASSGMRSQATKRASNAGRTRRQGAELGTQLQLARQWQLSGALTLLDAKLRDDFFRDLLRRGYTTEDTEKQLNIAIDWGRYGELFDYDADTGEMILSEVAAALLPDLAAST